ncbi:MAG: glycoside-pentoside-hexuronide (GPH):cation symporter [Brevefilum sp.]|nr:glycoside-pentoside-hexuronide (GPH):cation symporter [Brevefilum sp.]
MGIVDGKVIETTPQLDKPKTVLTTKEMFAFFAVNLGNIPLMSLLGGFLLIFYTDVVGLNPAMIGTLFLLSRVLDGVNDPIMGYVIDHLPQTRMGRFRSYIIIGTIITTAVFLLMWLGPSMAPTGKMAIAFIGYILFGFVFDLMDIPLNAMIPVMSAYDNDRNILSNIKGIAYAVGGMVIYIITIPIVSSFATQRQGYHVLIIAASVFVLFFSILGTLGIRERVYPVSEQTYKFRDVLSIIGSKPVFAHFVNTLLLQIGNGLTQGTLIFFFTYVLKRPDLFSLAASGYIVGIILASFVTPILVRVFGKKNTKTFANLLMMVGLFVLFFLPADQPMLFVLVTLLISPGMGVNQILVYSIQADNTDYIEWKKGYRAEGAIAAVNSFIIKAGLGVGSAIGAYLLAYVNYVPNQAQTVRTIQGLYWVNYLIPAMISLIALGVWIFGYPLNKKMTQVMRNELNLLRGE